MNTEDFYLGLLRFGGYIQTVTDAPMFLERVVINTAMVDKDGNAGPLEQVVSQAPKAIVTKGDDGLYSVTGCGTDFLQWKWAEMNRAVGEVAA